MRKAKFLILLLPFLWSGNIISQNIGINATGALPNASAMLDVSSTNKGVLYPNINLTSQTDGVTIPLPATGLTVWNTNVAMPCRAGYYYNAGTPASPAWVCLKKEQDIMQMYGTAGRLNISSTVHTAQPGLTAAFTIPAGQTASVTVMGDIGIRNVLTTTSAYSIVDVIIYLDGAFLPVGGWNRIETLNGTNQNSFQVCPTSATFLANPGAHTIEIRSARFGGTVNVDIGGNCALDTNCGEFTVFINYL